ncbi:helix-turn-helix domain-containing protein [Empedobacter tilapiae]|uniref:Helix-turn-helix domain-containing protein n=2 Tax=Empedobacter tilapiae TaxID=2491114 RepID=A0A4Z1B971_9FLAO|nr:helix-turn-helix domain-containing protein [Empedobacter tilapiae]
MEIIFLNLFNHQPLPTHISMNKIKSFDFKPISNENQKIHIISFSERIRRGENAVLRQHRANFYILLFITSGESQHLVDFNVHKIKKGDFLIIRPGQVHAFFPSKNSDGTIIAFTEDFLLYKSHSHFFHNNSFFLNELIIDEPLYLNGDKREDIYSLIFMIQKELDIAYDDLQESILQNHLASLLLNLLRIKRGDYPLFPKKSKEFLYALQFKSLIEKSYKDQLTISEYAKKIGISIRNLQRISEAHFGKSPKLMVQEFLLLESKRMLLDPSLQIKEIAYELGFNEPTNFTKFFKKFEKTSPESFRKSMY